MQSYRTLPYLHDVDSLSDFVGRDGRQHQYIIHNSITLHTPVLPKVLHILHFSKSLFNQSNHSDLIDTFHLDPID